MREKIEAALAQLRPQLRMDGGDIHLLDVSPEGVVQIGLSGSCAGCPISRMLLKMSIAKRLGALPQVTKVLTVDTSGER